MIKVIVESVSGQSKGLAFEKDEITFGRSPDNDVILSSARASRHHARVFVENDVAYVEDLGSTNGVTINGEAIKISEVNPSDIILMGSVKVYVRYDSDQRISKLNVSEQSKGNIFDTISVSKSDLDIPSEPSREEGGTPFDETQKLPVIDKIEKEEEKD